MVVHTELYSLEMVLEASRVLAMNFHEETQPSFFKQLFAFVPMLLELSKEKPLMSFI